MATLPTSTEPLLLCESQGGTIRLDVRMDGETVWLSLDLMATLFGKSRTTVNEHVLHIYEEGELQEEQTKRKIGISDFSTKPTNFYNLDVIISVGYRVKSQQGTRFRQWATQRLREYLIKGFTLDDERLKAGSSYNYFKELLDRIREIRLSERIFYQQIKDIYATSIDYDPRSEATQTFYKEVQNKLLFAVSGQTAAELIYYRANASPPMMGLTTTKVPGKVRKTDVTTGKNYLTEEELQALKLIVEQYLAFAEAQARAQRPMYMKDWIERLGLILTMNEYTILDHAGKITHELALHKAEEQYALFREHEREVERLESIRELDRDLKALKG
jgi:toxin-antitoxin system, toxin component, fic family